MHDAPKHAVVHVRLRRGIPCQPYTGGCWKWASTALTLSAMPSSPFPLRRQWPGHAAQVQGRACKSQTKNLIVQNLIFPLGTAADHAADHVPAQGCVVSQSTVLALASPATAVAGTCTVPAERAEAELACVSPWPFSERRLGPGRQRRVGAVHKHGAGVGLARVGGGEDLQRGRERLAVPGRKRDALRRRGRAAAGAGWGGTSAAAHQAWQGPAAGLRSRTHYVQGHDLQDLGHCLP